MESEGSLDKIKLIDFGISYAWSQDDTSQHKEGTLYFCPPEMLRKVEEEWDYTVTPKSDIYSMGVTLYKLVTNKMPFWGEKKSDVIDKILEGDLWFPKNISSDLWDLIWRLLKEKLERPDVDELMYHPWLQ